MTIFFQVQYHTKWGEQLALAGSLPELGQGNLEQAPMMQYQGDGVWQTALTFKKTPASLEYQYVLVEEQGLRTPEAGDLRQVRIPRKRERMVLKDTWKSATHADNPFYTAAFLDVICKPSHLLKPSPETVGAATDTVFQFQLTAARIPEGFQFALLGSLPELGAWNPSTPLLLGNTNYPFWSVEVALPYTDGFEYKYGLFDPKQKRWIDFETGANRSWKHTIAVGKSDYVLLADAYFQYPVAAWKGAGVAIPVFSLRTQQSLGNGEFRDLAKLTDWAKQVGLKFIQVLPVNDTTVRYSWEDSYPYSAISVFALHPMFLALDAIPGAVEILGKKNLEEARQRLNAPVVVDYDEMIALKRAWTRKIFDVQQQAFLSSPAFQEFLAVHKHWLEPYAVFCYLRDKKGTADFTQWGEYAVFNPSVLKQLADPSAPDFAEVAFFYFQQFYLDQQLSAATEYARSQGVVLKGDLPIGIYRHSVDAWVAPKLYNMDGQAGAPPDPFSANGQNWGFPTYNWEEMAKDNYLWWRQRMTALSRYFDAYRIDHILGFFRIWEIPLDHIEGMMGRFRPAIPILREEFDARGIFFDATRFCTPYITAFMLEDLFEAHTDWVKSTFLEEVAFHQYAFKPALDTQRKVEAFFTTVGDAERANLQPLVYKLFSEVLFFEEPGSNGQAFHPRIDFPATRSFQVLSPDQQDRLRALHHDYFYNRQEAFWRKEAMLKLPALKKATNMLICGEDLGMVPASVPGVMRELGILSLEIQRMSKNPSTEFLQVSDIPYASVTSPSTHDMAPIRAWWEESDRDQIRRFYTQELHLFGDPPLFCEPYIAQAIIHQHLNWPNMLAIFPLQDLLAMDGALRRENPFDERINVPANPKHYWQYRMHLPVEALLESTDFNERLLRMLQESGRA